MPERRRRVTSAATGSDADAIRQLGLGDRSANLFAPHPALNRHDRVGGERHAARGVQVQHRLPQPDAPSLQQVGIGHVAIHASPQHKVGQSLMLTHEAILAHPTARLGTAKPGRLGQVMCAVVLAQQRVENKTNEIRAAPELLRGRDLQNTVTTMDALLTQRTIAQHILDQKGDYLMVVKDNQHELWTAIDVLFHASPLPRGQDDRQTVASRDKAHGRIERRTLESSAALKDYLDWPGVNQVLRCTCHRVEIKTGRVSEEVTYGITSLGQQRARLEQVEQFWRGHWTIENRVHYVRDESMGEDRCQVHTGQAPQALAALRNGVLNAIRHCGWKNVAAALRHFEASAVEALALLGVGVS